MLDKFKGKIVGVVPYRGYILKDLGESLVDKPVIRGRLDLDEVRHRENCLDTRIAHTLFLANFNGLGHRFPPLEKQHQKGCLDRDNPFAIFC